MTETDQANSSTTPESTPESVGRRNFVRKAAILTAAAGMGAAVLEKSISIIPESSAKSAIPKRTIRGKPPSSCPRSSCRVNVTTFPCCCNAGSLAVFSCATNIEAGYDCFDYGPARLYSSLRISSYVPTSCSLLCCPPFFSPGVLIVCNSYPCETSFPIAINGATESNCASTLNPRTPVGVLGTARKGVGVLGQSSTGPGIEAISCGSPVGVIKNKGAGSNNSSLLEFESGCSTPAVWYQGVGGAGNAHGLTSGQFFILEGCQPKMVVNKCGKVGIGTSTPNVTLQVNGGMSLATKTETTNYTMASSDFAVLADANSKKITITLPPASNTGQVVLVKKADSSKNPVIVAAQGTDKIEGAISRSLASQYSSLTLFSGGSGVWYILSSAT